MEKFLYGILCLALCGLCIGGCNGGENTHSIVSERESSILENSSLSMPETSEEGKISYVSGIELGEYFTSITNGNEVYISGIVTLKTTDAMHGTFIGESNQGDILISGGEAYAVVEATGLGVGAIKAQEGSTLVFQNLTIRDTSLAGRTSEDRREGYLEFGGKLRFENCVFECAAYLCDDADAEFVNCAFDSGAENMYAVWISDGSASFTDCTFTGWRAIKLYEGSDNKYTSMQPHFDVVSVIVDGCLFDNLKKKPGLAIDVFAGKETSVTIKNSHFNGCQGGDGVDCIDGAYESDVDTATLTFSMENVLVNGNSCAWETDRKH